MKLRNMTTIRGYIQTEDIDYKKTVKQQLGDKEKRSRPNKMS